MALQRDLKLTPAAGVQFQSLGTGGGVLVNMTSGACFELNGVGSEIWSLLQQGASIADLISRVANRYGIASDTAERDILSWIDSLRTAGLVHEPGQG